MADAKKNNIIFTKDMDDHLLQFMLEQVDVGMRIDHGFKHVAYASVAKTMSETRKDHGYTAQTIKNRCKQLKKLYIGAKELRDVSGFGWDSTTKRITASEDVWRTYIEVHRDASKWRDKYVDLDALHKCFGKDAASGDHAHTSSYTYIAPIEDESHTHNSVGHDELEDDSSLGQDRAESSSRVRGSRKKLKMGEELMETLRASSESLRSAIMAVADGVSYPKDLRWSEDVAIELKKITELSEREMEACHVWLSLNKDMSRIFLAWENKKDWILRRLPDIMETTSIP